MRVNKVEIAWYLEEFHDTVVPNGRQPKIRCPFHEDRTPSASVYKDSERLKCYSGCFDGRAVDVIDIEQEIHNLTFQEAVEKVRSWPGTLVQSSGQHQKSTKAERRKRAKRTPYSFKILGQ